MRMSTDGCVRGRVVDGGLGVRRRSRILEVVLEGVFKGAFDVVRRNVGSLEVHVGLCCIV